MTKKRFNEVGLELMRKYKSSKTNQKYWKNELETAENMYGNGWQTICDENIQKYTTQALAFVDALEIFTGTSWDFILRDYDWYVKA